MEWMDTSSILQLLFRWMHFVAGITWIGILYFFNLVNVNFMKTLDAPTKGKVIPNLMPSALWYFRWGAAFTVLTGIIYFAVWIVGAEGTHAALGIWLVMVLAAWAVMYFLIEVQKLNNGNALAAIIAVLVIAMSYLVAHHAGLGSTKSVSIGIGGGIGMLMFLNVWGIIWRHQKRIIAWTAENAAKGTAIPPEAAALGRRAFLASRTNAWLSLPMLFFMGNASHPMITFATH
ncbi:MAG TPA: urate hydroxylase PuuD [Candidatus Polarisedimenticolia bacterium]|nr:urate hydroxylase PuuD [Candidatus Polarisedimenticolia bacterium]